MKTDDAFVKFINTRKSASLRIKKYLLVGFILGCVTNIFSSYLYTHLWKDDSLVYHTQRTSFSMSTKLYTSQITVMNNGKNVLFRNDYKAEIRPLHIVGNNIEQVSLDSKTTSSSETYLKNENGMTYLYFKWLNPGERIVLNVSHKNISDFIGMEGAFAGVSQIKQTSTSHEILRQIILCFCLGLMITLFVISIIWLCYNKIVYNSWFISTDKRIYFWCAAHLNNFTQEEKLKAKHDIYKNLNNHNMKEYIKKYKLDSWDK